MASDGGSFLGIYVPEFLAELGMEKDSTEMLKAVGDCAVIAFYYLQRVGEYTAKKKINQAKQTVQLNLEDTMFFHQDSKGNLRQLTRKELYEEILSAD